MKLKILLTSCMVGSVLFLGGCTRMYNSNEVSLANTNQVLSYEKGIVTDVRMVVIKDNGSGTMIGVIAGTVLGSLLGNGKGNVLTTLGGGLAGAYVGTELDKANAEELFIKLDSGKNIVVVAKGVDIRKGDRVRIVLDGSRVVRVERI